MDHITYQSSDEDQRVKAQYWVRARKQGVSREEVTLASALSLTGDARLTSWWNRPGFSLWFANDTEFEEEMEYLVNRMPHYLRGVLDDQSKEASPAAKVNALKLLAEITSKMPERHKKIVWKDAAIQSMTPDQLRRFIERESRKLRLKAPNRDADASEAVEEEESTLAAVGSI